MNVLVTWTYHDMNKQNSGMVDFTLDNRNEIQDLTFEDIQEIAQIIKQKHNLDGSPVVTNIIKLRDSKKEKPKKVMREVWVIVDYNNHSVEGVYSSESLARQVFETYAHNDYYYIENETMWEE